MDIQTTIIVIILLSIFVVPFWLIIRVNKRREMKYIQRLIEAGKQYQLQFTAQEAWSERAIGIDAINKKVMFLNLKHTPPSEMLIDLANVSACKLFKQGEVRQGLPDPNAKIELQFTPKQGHTSIPVITFFDMSVDDPMQMGPCQDKAKACLEHINACL